MHAPRPLHPARAPLARAALHCLLGPLAGLLAALVLPFAALASEVSESVRLLVDERMAVNGGEVEVVVGEPDPRLKLAPCARMEPFVPTGARLMGRTSLGVRCLEGANWVVYLPVQIKLFVDAWVAARPLARGQVVGAEDARLEHIDVAALNGNAVLPDMPLVGRTATRTLSPGEPFRRDALRAVPVVQPGDAVQVIALGTGFAAQTAGKALTAASKDKWPRSRYPAAGCSRAWPAPAAWWRSVDRLAALRSSLPRRRR
jgi:flagellar basal body P-ring formation protein FlgA